MQIDLNGKVILITGASSGIGRSLAIKLASEGAYIAFCYNRHEVDARVVCASITELRGQCLFDKVDVADDAEVGKFVKKVHAHYGHIDVLINNAGLCSDNLIGLMTASQWREVIDVNLTGTFNFTKYIARCMITQRRGKIFNIASSRGLSGSRGQINYSAAKAGIIGLTKTSARELGEFNIMANAVCPPFLHTNLNNNELVREQKKNKAEHASVLKRIGSFDDVNHFFMYACSDMFQNISGQVFTLDTRLD